MIGNREVCVTGNDIVVLERYQTLSGGLKIRDFENRYIGVDIRRYTFLSSLPTTSPGSWSSVPSDCQDGIVIVTPGSSVQTTDHSAGVDNRRMYRFRPGPGLPRRRNSEDEDHRSISIQTETLHVETVSWSGH